MSKNFVKTKIQEKAQNEMQPKKNIDIKIVGT